MVIGPKYDLMILLTGEDKTFPRSRKAIEVFHSGRIGDVLISGSVGAMSDTPPDPEEGPHTEILNYLNLQGRVPAQYLHIDWRSVDTLGNFVFPYANPLENNPNPNDLSAVLLTEVGHWRRAYECATKVMPEDMPPVIISKGKYQGSFESYIAEFFHQRMMRAMQGIEKSPEAALQFLVEKHPFYKKDWFKKNKSQRLRKIAKIISFGF